MEHKEFSLRGIVKQRLLEMLDCVKASAMGKILVVDQQASELLTSVFELNELYLAEVSLLEQVNKPRDPYPQVEAIYLLTPCWESIFYLINDFVKGGDGSINGAAYKGAHVFFTTELNDEYHMKLMASRVSKYFLSINELFLDFYALESHLFSLETPESFFRLYSPKLSNTTRVELQSVAQKLLSLCVTLKERPAIRYFSPESQYNNSSVSRELASLLESELDIYSNRDSLPGSRIKSPLPNESKSTLIIVDRTIDLASPLVHEFTYQAMASDLLQLENGSKYVYEYFNENNEKSTKKVVLDESDKLWVELRHCHFDECVPTLVGKLKELEEKKIQNQGSERDQLNKLNQLKKLVYSLPEYQELKAKCGVHINIASECSEYYKSHKIELLAGLEQDLATGFRSDGKAIQHMLEEVLSILKDDDIHPDDKMRVLILYILSKDGVRAESWEKINDGWSLDEVQGNNDAIQNLATLGARLTRTSGKPGAHIVKRLRGNSSSQSEIIYDLSRFTPTIKRLLEDEVHGDLSNERYPYVRMMNDKTQAAKEQHAKDLRQKLCGNTDWIFRDKSKGMIILFVAGGITYSEIRSAYEVAEYYNRDIFIGSTHIINPTIFLEHLRILNNPPSVTAIEGSASPSLPLLNTDPHLNKPLPDIQIPATTDTPHISHDRSKSYGGSTDESTIRRNFFTSMRT
ncbi:Sec1-like protein [Basidiobolus meristosporus CBS 931.73]|uniref:Sec1-like protein n=1 Tax=Basidiobolus meristosporus CBS 931.73 TaxID=1314790 RepID=A0A1Y1Y4G1_9FUNG|nr:Sec1-like protein [Basidiobolus meristosporus CBS 931.73]|eukprot:ORX92868.1 Sec1-like protein [Basidiobolus meristosporus CBS 931.73]